MKNYMLKDQYFCQRPQRIPLSTPFPCAEAQVHLDQWKMFRYLFVRSATEAGFTTFLRNWCWCYHIFTSQMLFPISNQKLPWHKSLTFCLCSLRMWKAEVCCRTIFYILIYSHLFFFFSTVGKPNSFNFFSQVKHPKLLVICGAFFQTLPSSCFVFF